MLGPREFDEPLHVSERATNTTELHSFVLFALRCQGALPENLIKRLPQHPEQPLNLLR